MPDINSLNATNDHSQPAPGQGTRPIPSADDGLNVNNLASQTIRGEDGMLELLGYVETRLRILPGLIQVSRQSDTGALEEMRFNLQARLGRLETLLRELEGEVDMAFEG